ncbi:hypothetical protein [Aerococcus urinaeequi]|uniref:hypothetical protein n=1 Tax=Aerococcus urinaeequi TaxID=51665 RepID=UPI003D6A4216
MKENGHEKSKLDSFARFIYVELQKLLQFNNAKPFQKREGSRRLIFTETGQEKLRPLPSILYEIAEWVYGRTVKLDCHITFQKNNYSCP